ncbi:MAG: GIY-YIG nuclease family protein [Saprospiraceae bacterium]
MKGYLYILECSNGQYYTGSTNDLAQRFLEHQNGEGSNFTWKHLPVKIVYVEIFEKVEFAFKREQQIQGWSRKKKEALMSNNIKMLRKLATCRNNSSSKYYNDDFLKD